MTFLVQLEKIIASVNDVLVAYVLVAALLSIGAFYTIYLALPQFRFFARSFKESFGDIFSKNAGIGAFEAMMISISAQVGTGNIIGVATALSLGGAGAIFWMWAAAFLGMATILAEGVLAQRYKIRQGAHFIGGPAFYIRLGCKKIIGRKAANFLAAFFAIAIIIALGIAGQMVQSNSISGAMKNAFSTPEWLSGSVIAALAGFVIIGGISRIAKFAQIVVPFMALCYIFVAVYILFRFHERIAGVFELIIHDAFSASSVTGAAAGIGIKEAIRYGVARGLFANEAGLGSTPHAHAAAITSRSASQGLVAMLAVFIDTAFICTATALIILLSGVNLHDAEGIALTTAAFKSAFGDLGVALLAICLAFFAFTTIIGWFYFAQINVIYLFSARGVGVFKVFFIVCIFVGAFLKVDFVWSISDLCNTLMVLPNAIALALLAPVIKREVNKYSAAINAKKSSASKGGGDFAVSPQNRKQAKNIKKSKKDE